MYLSISPNSFRVNYPGQFKSFVTLVLVLVLTFRCSEAGGRGSINIQNNGYRQILVAIGDNVEEDLNLLHRIQEVFTRASQFLYNATRQRAYFAEMTILIPKTWGTVSGSGPATNQAMDVSDIVVDKIKQNNIDPNQPFVFQLGSCGNEGEYMQLSSDYLTKDDIANRYGTYEKMIVREWAKLRYGVFDEYADGGSGRSFFYVDQNGEIEGTRCSTVLKGEFYDVNKNNARCDFENGLPNRYCRFDDQKTVQGKYGSLMYNHQLSHITEFCDSDPTSPNTLHNRQAPSQHNTKCDEKSVWEVMREHDDFKDGANAPRQVNSTKPTFRLVKYSRKRTVIVLDTSWSMIDNNKIDKLAQAVSNYILNVVIDGEELGIVWFNETAVIKSYLTPVSDTTRKQLVRKIPKLAEGFTSIGDGLQKALEVLSYGGQNPAGGVILLVSDGEESFLPYIVDVQQEIMDSSVRVDSIAITEHADNQIELLAKNTSGQSFYFSDKDASNALNDAFIAQSQRDTDSRDRPILLASNSMRLGVNQSFEYNMDIDSTIGRNTKFVISYMVNAVTVELTAPSGQTITNDDPQCAFDPVFTVTSCNIKGIAEPGRWVLRMLNLNPSKESITITVTSNVLSNATLPILAVAKWGKRFIKFPDERQVLYVSVVQGRYPVLEANVEAYLDTPTSGIDDKRISFKVLDNGAGSDSTRNDGIYSTYVTEYTNNGRYNVKVRVSNSPVTVIVQDRIVGTSDSGSITLNRKRRALPSRQETGNFRRVTSAGSFTLENFTIGIDAFPPAKITDLRVSGVSLDGGVTLTWTSTGEDLDRGTASSYVIWKSTVFDTLYDDHRSAHSIPLNNSPKVAGSAENFGLHINDKDKSTYFFAIEAVDKNGNTSPRSNIVSVSMTHVKPTPVKSSDRLDLTIGLPIGIFLLVALVVSGFIIYRYRFSKKRAVSQNGEDYKLNFQETSET